MSKIYKNILFVWVWHFVCHIEERTPTGSGWEQATEEKICAQWQEAGEEYIMRSYVERMGEMRNAYKIFVGIPEGKKPLWRLKRRWENIIGLDLREERWGEKLSTGFIWLRIGTIGGTCEQGNKPSGAWFLVCQGGLRSMELDICYFTNKWMLPRGPLFLFNYY